MGCQLVTVSAEDALKQASAFPSPPFSSKGCPLQSPSSFSCSQVRTLLRFRDVEQDDPGRYRARLQDLIYEFEKSQQFDPSWFVEASETIVSDRVGRWGPARRLRTRRLGPTLLTPRPCRSQDRSNRWSACRAGWC